MDVKRNHSSELLSTTYGRRGLEDGHVAMFDACGGVGRSGYRERPQHCI